ncbi:MAG: hypothetical protein WAN66_07005 [Limnoraphis robusta]
MKAMISLKSCGLAIATAIIAIASSVQAQSSGATSLVQVGCLAIQGGGYYPENQNLVIGFQVFTFIAYLGNPSSLNNNYLSQDLRPNQKTQVACKLPSSNKNPRNLTLVIGIPDNHYKSNISRLSIYKDGQFYESRELTKGQKIEWIVDVANVKTLGLEGQCLSTNDKYCPAIYFLQDDLE